jgi:hypothetical protein
MTTQTSIAGLTIPTLADVNAFMVARDGEAASVCESNTTRARVTVVFADTLGEVTRSMNPQALDADGWMDYTTELAVANTFAVRENARYEYSLGLNGAIAAALDGGNPVLLFATEED